MPPNASNTPGLSHPTLLEVKRVVERVASELLGGSGGDGGGGGGDPLSDPADPNATMTMTTTTTTTTTTTNANDIGKGGGSGANGIERSSGDGGDAGGQGRSSARRLSSGESAGTCITEHSSMDVDGRNNNSSGSINSDSDRNNNGSGGGARVGVVSTARASSSVSSSSESESCYSLPLSPSPCPPHQSSRGGGGGGGGDGDGGGARSDLQGADVERLRRILEPIRVALEKVDALGVLGLDPCGNKGGNQGGWKGCTARVSDVVFVRPIHDSIVPPRCRDRDTCVRYLHIDEREGRYSMGVFVFPPDSTIPLHDHPGMCVLSRVLYGTLRVRSFDVVATSGRGAGVESNGENKGGDDDDDDDDNDNDDDDSDTDDDDGNRGRKEKEAADSAKRTSSFGWVAEVLAVRHAAVPSYSSPSPDVAGGGGAGDDSSGDPHRPKVVNRTGSWLSSVLFPYRKQSSFSSVQSSSTQPSHPQRRSEAEANDKDEASQPGRTRRRRRRRRRRHRRPPPGSIRAFRTPTRRIMAPHVQALFPSEGNAHEFTAGPEGAAVLDVLMPPYDFDHDRDCTFYRPKDDDDDDDDDDVDDNYHHDDRRKGSRACWLVPIAQPKGFHCISGTYSGFSGDNNDG